MYPFSQIFLLLIFSLCNVFNDHCYKIKQAGYAFNVYENTLRYLQTKFESQSLCLVWIYIVKLLVLTAFKG